MRSSYLWPFCPSLSFFNFIYVFFGVRAPDSWCIFNLWTDKGVVCHGFDIFILVTTFLLTKPIVLLAVLVILFMWVFQLRSLLMVTPRYFAASTDSSCWLCMKYLDFTGLFERVIWITWHLPGLNFISQVLSQCWRDFKSDWSTWLSCIWGAVR